MKIQPTFGAMFARPEMKSTGGKGARKQSKEPSFTLFWVDTLAMAASDTYLARVPEQLQDFIAQTNDNTLFTIDANGDGVELMRNRQIGLGTQAYREAGVIGMEKNKFPNNHDWSLTNMKQRLGDLFDTSKTSFEPDHLSEQRQDVFPATQQTWADLCKSLAKATGVGRYVMTLRPIDGDQLVSEIMRPSK